MKLFIYEHLTSGALSGQDYSEDLCHEGDLMLNAISNDLIELGYAISTLRDQRLRHSSPPLNVQLNILWVDSVETYQALWQQCLKQYDYFLLIAPETDGTLLELQQQVIDAGKHVLGSDQNSTQLCSDKLASYQTLSKYQLKTPRTWLKSDWLMQTHPEHLWITKPIDGAGCEHTYVFDTAQTKQFLEQQTSSINYIVQPFVAGQSFSLTLFINKQQINVISINEQVIERTTEQLHLKQCKPILNPPFSIAMAEQLAENICSALPGLWSFVGIDLVWANTVCWIIEINPRLTLSYSHPQLRQDRNPAYHLHNYLQSFNQASVS